jgi:hypothetical protein
MDAMKSQPQQSAEFLCSFRQALLPNPHQGGTVSSHHRHAQLDGSTMRPFVAQLSGTTGKQTGDVTFHDWSAVATGEGEVHLVWRAFSVQACCGQAPTDLLLGGRWRDRCDRLGDTNRENPSRMQRMSHHGVIGPQITRHRMDGQLARHRDPGDGGLDLVHQGYHIAGIARIADRKMRGKDKAGGGLRDDSGLAPKLGRTVAFALEDGRNSAVVRIDDFTLTQPLALRQPARLFADGVIGFQRCLQLAHPALALALGQLGRALETLLCGLCQCGNGTSPLQQLLFGLAHQRHEDFALPPALPAKAAHDLLEVPVERAGLRRHCGGSRGALRRDLLDELEDFF